MNSRTAKTELGKSNFDAEIIGYADNTHYLAALVSRQGDQQLVKDAMGKPLRFAGMHQAKEWFRTRGFERATLRVETPYDEFIGQPAGPTMIPIPLNA